MPFGEFSEKERDLHVSENEVGFRLPDSNELEFIHPLLPRRDALWIRRERAVSAQVYENKHKRWICSVAKQVSC